ncbi:hypothetical protein WAX88_15355 [Photobacterium damselae subsp. damselae]|uniref:hypothetical protein n=1 Tax=Photobacterium damselae TaxID=38293 RepID=UPI00311B0239
MLYTQRFWFGIWCDLLLQWGTFLQALCIVQLLGIKMNKKIIPALKYVVVFILGFITNFSGLLNNITSIPSSYNEFKKVYLYNSDLLSGTWSNNMEYLLNSDELELGFNQPRITMNLGVNEFGEVNGEILSKKVCDTLPLTWVISMESPEPNLSSFFLDRKFYLKQLKSGKMETVAIFKLTEIDDRKNTLLFERVEDRWGVLPKHIRLAKNLPSYDTDFKELSEYCAESPARFREQVRKMSMKK